ncbi:hypothetical protein [Selenomonas ruminantium]|nr:hypothetical protein [Selenomonas ruminantium]
MMKILKWIFIAIAGLMVCGFLSFMITTKMIGNQNVSQQANTYQDDKSQNKKLKVNAGEYNLGVKEEDFRNAFNENAKSELKDLKIGLVKENIDLYEGDVAHSYNSIVTPYSQHLFVSYEPDTQLVRGIMLTGNPQDELEAIHYIGVITNIVAILNPDLSPEERTNILKKLGMFDGKKTNYRALDTSTQNGNITYKIKGTEKSVDFMVTAKGMNTVTKASTNANDPHNFKLDYDKYIMWKTKVYLNRKQGAAKYNEMKERLTK